MNEERGAHYGVFALPDTDTDTDTDKKWVIKYCVEVFTLHRHNYAIEYCHNLSGSVSVSVSVSGSVNAPLPLTSTPVRYSK